MSRNRSQSRWNRDSKQSAAGMKDAVVADVEVFVSKAEIYDEKCLDKIKLVAEFA
ncbi:hypothetical protein HYR99_14395 [Candidatus Poribacteria bacterium]|nr:hypothetical protein [Candidatus Poribacteria bacterium]